MKYYLFLLVCLMISCKGSEQGQSETELTLLMTDAYGGTPESGLEIFRDEGSLKKYFARVNRSRKPGIPVPEIDFSKHIAVAYSSGQTTDTIIPSLRAVRTNQDTLMLKAQQPEQVRDSFTAVRLPFALYLLPRTEKKIVME